MGIVSALIQMFGIFVVWTANFDFIIDVFHFIIVFLPVLILTTAQLSDMFHLYSTFFN